MIVFSGAVLLITLSAVSLQPQAKELDEAVPTYIPQASNNAVVRLFYNHDKYYSQLYDTEPLDYEIQYSTHSKGVAANPKSQLVTDPNPYIPHPFIAKPAPWIKAPELHSPYDPYTKSSYREGEKIPGVAGQDYPIYHEAPKTNFDCESVPYRPGIYADVETGCQAYHVCHDGRYGRQGAVFLCTNGTIFNQYEFTCDWWYNVDCAEAPSLYNLNLDPDKNPYTANKDKEYYK